jgi:alpha-amylase
MILKHEESAPGPIFEDNTDTLIKKPMVAYNEDYTIVKEEPAQNSMTVTARKSDKNSDKNIVELDTDIPGHVVLHWGVYMDGTENWHVPPPPYPKATKLLHKNALQTLLEVMQE